MSGQTSPAATQIGTPSPGGRVSMLLLGSPEMDARVIKTVRSLQQAGHSVTLYYVAKSGASAMPDFAGATVQWVTAPRPMSRIASAVRAARKHQLRQPAAAKGTPGAAPARASLFRDLRAISGTLWLNLALWNAARHSKPQIVHANDLDTLLAGVLLEVTTGAQLVYDAHELYPEMMRAVSALYRGLWRLFERPLIRRASAVITVNASIARELCRRYDLPRLPAVVMNCPPLTAEPVPRSGHVGEILLIFQGGLNPERGLEDLVAAVPWMDGRAVLCLRGPGPLREPLRQLARRMGIEQRVRILDPVPQDRVISSLEGFALGLVPYVPVTLNTYLGTPNKLFEYMMAGLPLVAGDLPEVARIVGEAGSGMTYPAADMRALAAAVNEMLAAPARLEHYREAGRAAAIARYNWQAQARNLCCLYEELLSGRA